MYTTIIEKIITGLNLCFGALSFLFGLIFLLLITGETSSSHGMAAAVIFTWAILGITTLPIFAHGLLYFKCPMDHNYRFAPFTFSK